MSKPTGKLQFCYESITNLERKLAKQQAEIEKLKEALESKDYVIDRAIDFFERLKISPDATEEYEVLEEALRPFIPDVHTVNRSK